MRKPPGKRLCVALLSAAAVIHIITTLSLRYQFLNPLFYITTHAKGQGGCFFGIYQAGVNLLNGESIYATSDYRPVQNMVVPFYHFFRYLPFSSYISALFTKILEPWPAYWVWVAVNEALLALCVLMTIKLRHRFGNAAIGAAAMWLFFSPLYAELYLGQFCFLMTFFIFVLIYPQLRSGSNNNYSFFESTASGGLAKEPDRSGWLHSGAWILSVLLKSFTALYTVTFIKMGKKKLAAAAVAAVVLTSLPYFLGHPEDLKRFISLNFQPFPSYVMGGCFGFSTLLREVGEKMPLLSGLGQIRVAGIDLAARNILSAVAITAVFFTTFVVTIRKKEVDPLGSITLWTLTFFLVFKDIWEYHYVVLIPLFIGFYLKTRSRYILALFILLALPTPFILYDIPGSDNPQQYWSAPLSILHHSFKSVPTFLFYLWVLRREIRGGDKKRELNYSVSPSGL